MPSTLKVEAIAPHLQIITLSRPEALNAIDTQLASDLKNCFADLNQNKHPDVRAVILTGQGMRSFCAGADLKERQGMSDQAWFAQHKIFEAAGDEITRCPYPLIAAVNGYAFGGGLELAMACDIILASDQATFAQSETKLGIIPGLGGTQRLARLVGLNRAKELILTGRTFTAQEAQTWGLLNHLHAPEQLLTAAIQMASAIAANGPIAIRQAKRAIDGGYSLNIESALAFEIEAYNQTVNTSDRVEGIRAFNQKRKPEFENQ